MGTGGGLQYSLVYDSQSVVNMSRVIVRVARRGVASSPTSSIRAHSSFRWSRSTIASGC